MHATDTGKRNSVRPEECQLGANRGCSRAVTDHFMRNQPRRGEGSCVGAVLSIRMDVHHEHIRAPAHTHARVRKHRRTWAHAREQMRKRV
eukprot:10443041-Alexandrium_andersonii.AAC.1